MPKAPFQFREQLHKLLTKYGYSHYFIMCMDNEEDLQVIKSETDSFIAPIADGIITMINDIVPATQTETTIFKVNPDEQH